MKKIIPQFARIALVGLSTIVLSFSSASAADGTWIGGSGSNYSTAANWSPSGQPSGSDIATFNSAAGTLTFTTGTTTGSQVWVDNGVVTWDIGAGNSLTMGAAESVKLGSTSAGQSTLNVVSGAVNTLGNLRVGRDVFPGTTRTAATSNSTLSISGTGTELNYRGTAYVGGFDGQGTISVTDGALFFATRTNAGGAGLPLNSAVSIQNSNSVGGPVSGLNVSGAGSVADLGGSISDGFGFGLSLFEGPVAKGNGPAVTVTDGGYLHTLSIMVGCSAGILQDESTILVDGAGSKLRFERATTGNVADQNASVIAPSAAGRLTVQNSGLVEAANNLQITGIGTGTARKGTLEIIGADSLYVAVSSDSTRRNVTLGTSAGQGNVATLRLADGGTLDLSNGGTVSNGTLLLVSNNSRIIGSGGNISANIDSAGILAMGDAAGQVGALTLTGDYTAQSAATHLFELGGTGLSSFDRMVASGQLTLDGAMTVTFINSFSAGLGDSFALLTGAGVTGTFSSVALPTLSGGLSWNEDYTNGYAINVVPEPTGLVMILGGCIALMLGSRRVSASRRNS